MVTGTCDVREGGSDAGDEKEAKGDARTGKEKQVTQISKMCLGPTEEHRNAFTRESKKVSPYLDIQG